MPSNTLTTARTSSALEIAGLNVEYDDGTHALKNVDLRVPLGEFCVIVGRSGCGKTTLLKTICGLVPPKSGFVDRPARVRMVFQDVVLLPWLSVAQNIALGLDDQSPASQRIANVASLLKVLQISHLAERYPANISGGEQQRAAIGRAFAAHPDLVCCDEPFAQLDVITREQLQTWLLEFWEHHRTTVIFSTHDLEEALLLGDRLVVLSDGHITFEHRVEFPRPRGGDLRYDPAFIQARKTLRERLNGDLNLTLSASASPTPV